MAQSMDLLSTLHARTGAQPKKTDAPPGGRLHYVLPVGHFEPAAPLARADGERDGNAPDESAIWKRRQDIREYPIERDVLLFHPELQLLCRLNETACFLWRNCDGRSVVDMTELLNGSYKVEPATARQHVLRIVELFAMNQFVYAESADAVAC